jgi:hypothetical protein
MTFALVSGCGSTNPSERTDEVGRLLTIPPRSSAPRVFANRCIPPPPLCSSRFDKRRRRRFGPRGDALQDSVKIGRARQAPVNL